MTSHQTRNGRSFVIKTPAESEASQLLDYSKLLFASTDQVLTTPAEFNLTVEDERKWIRGLNQNPNALLLVAELGSQIGGMLFFIPGEKQKNRHTGQFGLNVHPILQGQGIGRLLMETLIQWAKQHPVIEKLYLQAYTTNAPAISLYKTLGFREEGRFVNAIKQPSGQYVDVLQMYLFVK
jgi:ribosomal protein S18 acetylase RimI-like enzyme